MSDKLTAGVGVAGLCLLLALVGLTSSTLSVYNIQALGESDPALLNISYSIANYGFAPFGKTIIGKLVASPHFGEECNPEAETGVEYENKFMLIPRGECQFVSKTLNAQKLGAQMAIIMDDKPHQGMVIMSDNGYGYKATIPSIFIHYQDGEKLKALLQDNQGEDGTEVIMKITFQNEKTQKVQVSFYLQSNNRQSYRFVESFRRYYKKIQDNVHLQLIYANSNCPECLATDCYFNKNYCALNFIHDNGASNGKLILDQQVRQQVMFELHPQQWWNYMKYIGDQCGVIAQYQQCHQKALSHLGIDLPAFETQFKKSFNAQEDNRYLFSNQENLALAGVSRFPTVTLNRVKLRGTLNAEFVFDDICNTLQDPPSECQKYIETTVIENISHAWATLVLVIVLGILIFSIIFCLYRRHMKKKISKEMQGRVDDMVSKYIEFYSERSKT